LTLTTNICKIIVKHVEEGGNMNNSLDINYSNTLRNNLFVLRIIAQISPGRIVAAILQSFCNYFSWMFFSIIFVQYILSALEKKAPFSQIAGFLLGSMAIFFLLQLFDAWYTQRYSLISDLRIYKHISKILLDKANAVDISCYENPDFYDNYTKAVSEANIRAISILQTCSQLIVSLLTTIYVTVVMLQLDIFVALFTILPVIGSFVLGNILNKTNYQQNNDNIPFNRRMDYVNRAVFLQKYAKEIRLSKIFDVLKTTYKEGTDGLLKNIEKYKTKQIYIGIIRNIILYPLVFEGVWLYVIIRAIIIKNLALTDCVVLANAIVVATNVLLQVMDTVIKFNENGIYIKNLRMFLDYKEKISENQEGIIPSDLIELIEFRNVSFTYEGQKYPTLKNISFLVGSNEKLALVGHNGAGKTTIIKLLLRLYDVTEGEILINGINIKEYNVKAYRRLFGTVFQDFQMLSLTALENVAMDDIKDEAKRKICIDATVKSGIFSKLSSLSNGVDTILTREFDENGVVLSGGEFQKIAIARVFAKENSIIILDEPSSALDPIAEYKMYETLAQTLVDTKKERIAVLISHRLSSVVFADKILVLEKGRVVEEGTHSELIKANSKYYEMFKKQAENYLDNLSDEEKYNEEKGA